MAMASPTSGTGRELPAPLLRSDGSYRFTVTKAVTAANHQFRPFTFYASTAYSASGCRSGWDAAIAGTVIARASTASSALNPSTATPKRRAL